MSSVAPYSHERGELVNVRSRHWIVNGVRPNTLPMSALKPIINPTGEINTFLNSLRWGNFLHHRRKGHPILFRGGNHRASTWIDVRWGPEARKVISEWFHSEEAVGPQCDGSVAQMSGRIGQSVSV